MLIFLYGEDTFRSRQKLKEFKEKFLREVDPAGNSIMTIDGETAAMEKINEAIGTPSLFARKRMIIIEKIFANKSSAILGQAHDYFKKSEPQKQTRDGNIILFWDDISSPPKAGNKLFKLLSGVKFVQDFKLLSNTETANWVKKETEKRGAKIRHKAVFNLTSLLGSDLWQLSNEIDKLINYKQSRANKLISGDGGGNNRRGGCRKFSSG